MDQTRELRFEGIPNCRDLGGIRTKDGRVVREGLLLRSAHLARATSAGSTRPSGPTGMVALSRAAAASSTLWCSVAATST